MVVRLAPKKRKQQILNEAVELAKVQGYRDITREEVAKAAEISEGLINIYFTSIANLRQMVLLQAIQDEIPEIIAQHLATSHDFPIISERLRKLAADFVRSNNAQNTQGI